MGQSNVYYDRDCILCKQTKKRLSRFDWFNQLAWVPIQEIDDASPQLDRFSVQEEMHLITKNSTLYRGFYAVRRLSLQLPLLAPVGVLLYIPFVDRIGNPIYRWVARNRHRFFKDECEDGACQIHQKPHE
ncbi:thiol-disulfide oxidoreductase DCC family protein [Alkalihalobacillus sp. AL-G]|uniref:thiol-disulfide oxidoreductase DCC family protein n=1 Tax=Alkalihalobacillus sp. AL-G TaxID=2926399 RepID=UPI00272B532B|nr:DUF393 domain-containing protein [Alkalihalobacillus sp. AL-G]WLD92456.1 DUF393 domain-containing protein [Alkalihalobacillus sp. AL-G]